MALLISGSSRISAGTWFRVRAVFLIEATATLFSMLSWLTCSHYTLKSTSAFDRATFGCPLSSSFCRCFSPNQFSLGLLRSNLLFRGQLCIDRLSKICLSSVFFHCVLQLLATVHVTVKPNSPHGNAVGKSGPRLVRHYSPTLQPPSAMTNGGATLKGVPGQLNRILGRV